VVPTATLTRRPDVEETVRPEASGAPAGTPERRRGRRVAGAAGALLLLAVAVAATWLGYQSLLLSTARDIGAYGLIEALRPGYLLALAVLTVGFVTFVYSGASRLSWLGFVYVAAFTALLDGAPFLIEGTPRFHVTYVHLGFTDAIMRTGETLPLLDARFSWPGFFSLFAYLTEATGLEDPLALALPFPFIAKALWLAGTWVMLRALIKNPAACWLGLWLFQLVEWSGQHYFSPQSFGFIVFLLCTGVLLVAFDPKRESTPVSRLLLAVMVLVFTALVVSHQLSPFMVIAVAGALGVLGLSRNRSVWVLLVVVFMVWFSFFTVDYWAGHLPELFGDAGNVSGNMTDNVGERVRGHPSHQDVVYVRMGLTVLLGLFAALGVMLAWRKRSLDPRLVVLGLAPFASLGLQSYGGEGLIRAFLFVLPASAAGAALYLTSVRLGKTRFLTPVLVGTLLVVLLPAALVAKYGGEAYESATRAELRATAWLHENVEPGDMVASMAPAGYLRSSLVGEVDYVPALDEFETGSLRSVTALMRDHEGRRFLVITRSQYAYGAYVTGLKPGWQRQLIADLDRSPLYRLVHVDGTSRIYQLRGGNG
jgi:hypothetical protein